MAMFCIPKNLVDKLKESALKGEVDIKKLYEMTSEKRREFFAKHTNAELGSFINAKFEAAMISKQKTAMTDWAKSIFKPEAQAKPVYKSVIDKIKALDEIGVLDAKSEKAFLEDLVAEKLGVKVTPEEVKAISEKAEKIGEAQKNLGNNLGNPEKPQENIAFFKAKKAMDDYLLSLVPANRLRVLTGTVGRGMMLFSVKSPVLNVGSNFEVGFTEWLTRRFANRKLKGSDNALAMEFFKMANKIYQETGYDISRMTTLSDTGASGARVLGDTVHAQGPGMIRKGARVVENIVFKQMMGAPDVAFSSAHFADSLNLSSLKAAEGDPAKGRAYMLDAMKLEPQTPQGEVLREQAILDAQVATWTNDSWVSKVSMGIRKILNDVSGDLRVGDYFMPFVKTPANVIATGLDYAGLGFPKAALKLFGGWKKGDFTKEEVQGIGRDLTRAGLGLLSAFIIASMLDDEDFVGAYDPSRKQIEQLRNSTQNSVRIGGKWVSADWLGPLSIPVTAMMYARKYGDTKSEATFQYAKGMGAALAQAPGISDVIDIANAQKNKGNQTLAEMTGETQNYITEQIYSRLVPSFLSDLAKALDEKERVSGRGFEGIKAKIPGLRQTLEVKKDIFGEEIIGEPAWSDILFGSRVKTDKETAMVKELSSVSSAAGKGITFTDWDKTSSSTVGQFKRRAGEEMFTEAKTEYGKVLKEKLESLIKDENFQKLSDEAKVNAINEVDTKAMELVFKSYGFKYDKNGSDEPLKALTPEEKANRTIIFETIDKGSDNILTPDDREDLIVALKKEKDAGTMTLDEVKDLRNKYDRQQKSLNKVEGLLEHARTLGLEGEKLNKYIEKVQNKDFMESRGRDPLTKTEAKILKEKLLGPPEEKPKKQSKESYLKERGFLGLASDYVKAFTTDPSNAWKALTTKEELGIVEGNLVELQRFYGVKFSDKGGSQEYKKKRMEEMGIPWEERDQWKLEHITPVSAGGDNSEENLIPVNNEIHNFYTPIDIIVGQAVKDGKITRKEAKDLMEDFKVNKNISAEDVIKAIE